ncbi:hypothetical protein [Embleya sp. NPDC020630]|uniref:hypothetical protein n=1 Tax=Embleya sp. NPDC020630 TaxID=3363979 RepID=UPI00379C13A0
MTSIRRHWFDLGRHDDDPAPEVEPDPGAAATETTEDDEPEGADQLGDKGKQALDRMKAERAAAKKEAADAKREAAALARKVADFEDRDKSELEKATAKAEASAARADKATQRAVLAEVKAAAADFADAEDAAAFLDLTRYTDDAGDIDTEAIRTDLDALLQRKPHLRKATAAIEPEKKTPRPDPGQGSREPVPPADYRTATRDDLAAELAKVAPGFRLR